ncbi:MAG: nodulation protein NfeD [Anaerolineae bacterium]|jgi:membrane-bound serine protease (ClpP class)|nr:nodulation protein NfeD [Anaerolineae bacterium]MDX9832375.1 nodulation protein NfeD [Anaerolineae bacterium]
MKGKGRNWALLVLWLVLFLSVGAAGGAQGQAAAHVDVLEIEGAVTPIMISYIERGIATAEEDGAEALVVLLNTPGGQTDLMNRVISAMLASDVPVVVYVYPRGAYAASAGTLITLAGHAAAMAPGTTIGAASPVGSQGEDLGETMEAKVKEDLKAQARGLAARRGDEAVAWAESAIEEARAATAEEALELGVIDLVAGNLDELLAGLDGLEVVVNDRRVVLETAGAEVRELPMTFPEQFLHIITNPTVAFILLTVGLNALLFELSAPGGYVAGIVGAICLVLAFYALGVLPVNYAGLIFIILAFGLFVADVKAATGGVLTVGGVVSLVAGALLLFNSPLYRVSISAIVGVALVTGLFFAFAMTKVMQIRRRPSVTGTEGLIGQLGEARTALEPEGTVFVRGELWQAESLEGPIEKGERVEIAGVHGFRLQVRRAAPLPQEV